MLDNKRRVHRLSMADQLIVMRYVEQHKAEALTQTQSQHCRQIKATLGIEIHTTQLARIEQTCGIERSRGGTSSSRKDRSVVIAKELVRLMTKLGEVPNEDLADIAKFK